MNVYVSPQWWWRLLIVGAGVTGLSSADYAVVAYTTQSAVIVVGYYCGVLYWMGRRRTVDAAAPRLRGAVMSWVLLSGVVWHLLLAGGKSPLPGLAAADASSRFVSSSSFLVHYVLPAMVFLDWLLFRPYGAVRWRDLFLWMLYPLGYAAVVLGRGALFAEVGYRYPYPFLDPTFQGWTGVAMWLLTLLAGSTVLGAVLVAIDSLRQPSTPGAPASWPETAAPYATAPQPTAPNWPDAGPHHTPPPAATWADAGPQYTPRPPAGTDDPHYAPRPPAGTDDPHYAPRPPDWSDDGPYRVAHPTAAELRASEAWPNAGLYRPAPTPAAEPRTAPGRPAAGPWSAAPPSGPGQHPPATETQTASDAPAWPDASPYSAAPPNRPSQHPPATETQTAPDTPAWPDASPYSAGPPRTAMLSWGQATSPSGAVPPTAVVPQVPVARAHHDAAAASWPDTRYGGAQRQAPESP